MAKFEGENSYEKLFATIYGARMGNNTNSHKEYAIIVKFDEIAKTMSIPFIRSGYYGASSGYRGNNGDYGFFFNNTIYTNVSVRALVIDNRRLYKWSPSAKVDGFSVRYVAKCCVFYLLMLI